MAVVTRQAMRRLNPKTSILFLCDMQEKFRATVSHFPAIVQTSKRMLDAALLLDMPVVATEQYPKGLGRTVAELSLEANGVKPVEKTRFSMCVPAVDALLAANTESVVLCGIEAHACIYQTSVDLLERGLSVHVVVDACSSRSMVDRMYALEQMRQLGARLTTSECALLELLRDAGHPKFRDVQKLIMDVSPDSGLLGLVGNAKSRY